MRKLLLITLLIGNYIATAQNARVRQYTAPLAGTVVLRDVEDKYHVEVYNLESPAPDANADRKRLYDAKQESAKMFPYKRSNAHYKTTATPAPIVVKGYVADSLSGIPPDNDMAISKGNKAVSVINSSIAVSDPSTQKIINRKVLGLFTASVGLPGINNNRYDPKVIYDPGADKFICVILNGINEYNYILLGFSKTNDPAGQWNFYKIYGNDKNDTSWFDYPCIAITKDEFFLTGNKIKFNTSWQAGFRETVIYQVNKKSGYDSAATLTYQLWDSISYNGIQIRNLYPAKGGSGIMGPAQYFLSNRNFDVQNDTVFLAKVPDVIGSGNTNLDIKVLISPTKYGVPPEGRQPDTSVTLATNDGRFLGAYIDGDEIQFVSTTVAPVSGASGIFHGVVKNFAGAPYFSKTQIISVDTMDFGYPNVTFAGNPWGLRQSLISFNYTGPNIHPGVGALLFDGVGYSPIALVKTGEGSIKVMGGKQQRWGDYMGAQVDWNNTGTVWIEGIYGRANSQYGNWIAQLNSPLLSVKEKNQNIQSSVLYPNPASIYTSIKFEIPQSSALSFYIYDMQGKMVDKLTDHYCKQGANMIRFDITTLPTGSYMLKGVDANGADVVLHKFVKQ